MMSRAKVRQPVSAVMKELTATAFRAYGSRLQRYVLRRIRRAADAPDLTQEIYERFMRVPDRVLISNVESYLMSIANNVVAEAYERQRTNRVTYDSTITDQIRGGLEHAVPDDLADRLALQQELERALTQLPATQRAVVLLKRRYGYTWKEIAERTGLSEDMVGWYLTEARAKIRMFMEQGGAHASDRAAAD